MTGQPVNPNLIGGHVRSPFTLPDPGGIVLDGKETCLSQPVLRRGGIHNRPERSSIPPSITGVYNSGSRSGTARE